MAKFNQSEWAIGLINELVSKLEPKLDHIYADDILVIKTYGDEVIFNSLGVSISPPPTVEIIQASYPVFKSIEKKYVIVIFPAFELCTAKQQYKKMLHVLCHIPREYSKMTFPYPLLNHEIETFELESMFSMEQLDIETRLKTEKLIEKNEQVIRTRI